MKRPVRSLRAAEIASALACVLTLVVLLSDVCAGSDTSADFFDDFNSLENWQPLYFKKIPAHTIYETGPLPEGGHGLKTHSRQAASGLLCTSSFNPYETPVLRWRWRVENVLSKGDATRRDGDDYPLRIYVLFPYDSGRATFGMRAKYAVAKALYGEYPPHAALNYIWANRQHAQRILPSPYTERSQLVILRAGSENIGTWFTEKVNILDDYRAAFSHEPPTRATLAIMSDSDNTGEAAIAYLDYIRVHAGNDDSKGRQKNEKVD